MAEDHENPTGLNDYDRVIASLIQHEVDFRIIGGIAVIYHGHVRDTEDMHLFVRPTPENAKRIVAALEEAGLGCHELTVYYSHMRAAYAWDHGPRGRLGLLPVLLIAWSLATSVSGKELAPVLPIPAEPGENSIIAVRVAEETSESLSLDIDYEYTGNRGRAFIGARTKLEWKYTNHWAYKPDRLSMGPNTARVRIGLSATAPYRHESDVVEINMYTGGRRGNFLMRQYRYRKVWTRMTPSATPDGTPDNPAPANTKTNLETLRAMLSEFKLARGRSPESLSELVGERNYKEVIPRLELPDHRPNRNFKLYPFYENSPDKPSGLLDSGGWGYDPESGHIFIDCLHMPRTGEHYYAW